MKKLASFLWKVYHSPVFCRVGDFLVWNELNIFVFQGFPAVIVAISLGATQAVGYGSSEACWLDVKSGVAWAFIGPAILIISVSGYSLVLCFTSYQWNVRSTGCCDRKQIVSSVFSGLKSKMEKNQFWMFGLHVLRRALKERVSSWFLWLRKTSDQNINLQPSLFVFD